MEKHMPRAILNLQDPVDFRATTQVAARCRQQASKLGYGVPSA
jgi:hypothetical protein